MNTQKNIKKERTQTHTLLFKYVTISSHLYICLVAALVLGMACTPPCRFDEEQNCIVDDQIALPKGTGLETIVVNQQSFNGPSSVYFSTCQLNL